MTTIPTELELTHSLSAVFEEQIERDGVRAFTIASVRKFMEYFHTLTLHYRKHAMESARYDMFEYFNNELDMIQVVPETQQADLRRARKLAADIASMVAMNDDEFLYHRIALIVRGNVKTK